jgi:hypothetical protein
MSELKVNKVTPRSGTTVTLGDSGDSVAIPSGVGFNGFNHRNIIINGDMSIAQRSTSESITSSGYYTVDRFNMPINTMGTFTVSQSTDTPTGQGFATSTKYDCTTADASPAANDFIRFEQYVEAQNLQYLKFGTASASSLTLSFWVKSNKTGTYIAELRNFDGGRTICNSYTINASNTWEKKTITVAGDTDGSGAFNNDNGLGLACIFWLGTGTDFNSGTLATDWEATTSANRAVGQVNLADDTANEWYITGVQLEAGTTASDFEFLPYDVSLGRCLRYYEKIKAEANEQLFGAGFNFNTTQSACLVNFSKKRTAVSVTFSSTVAEFGLYSSSGSRIAATAIVASQASSISFQATATVASGLTAGNGTTFIANLSSNPYIEISAEI